MRGTLDVGDARFGHASSVLQSEFGTDAYFKQSADSERLQSAAPLQSRFGDGSLACPLVLWCFNEREPVIIAPGPLRSMLLA
jgi:hypothetical protein